jgi:H+/Cl- antiporter ClcA
VALGVDLRSRSYWRLLGWGLLVGFVGAAAAALFLGVVGVGTSLWPDLSDWEPFSGPWQVVVLMTVAGVAVGVIHRFSSARQMDVFEALNEGELDPRPIPASLLISLISLTAGFSLGPEVPTGMLAAGIATWLARRARISAEATRIGVVSGVSSAYAGLFSSPLAMLLILLESRHLQTVAYYGTLFIAGLASVIGFGLFFALAGETFSPLLGLLSPPAYDLQIWHLGAGVVLGVLGVPVALFFGITLRILGRLVAPLKGRPIVRSTLGGVLLGLLAVALPITIGLGTNEMVVVGRDAAAMGVGLLVVFAAAKLLALAGALSFGFIGGPIFPLLFVGSTLGTALNLMFPDLPLGLAVGCMTVAVPAALVPIPLALAAVGALIIGVSPENALPLVISSLVAFSVTHGLGLIPGDRKAAPGPDDGGAATAAPASDAGDAAQSG